MKSLCVTRTLSDISFVGESARLFRINDAFEITLLHHIRFMKKLRAGNFNSKLIAELTELADLNAE